nr:zinc finger, CCHC-type [Tanacetum cinerariifolium]
MYDNANVMMVMSVEKLLDWIMDSWGSYHMTYVIDYLVHYEEYASGNVLIELRRNLISLGTLEKERFIVKMQSGRNKILKGSLVVLSGTRRANYVYTLEGQAVTIKTFNGLQQHNGLVEDTNVTLLANVGIWVAMRVNNTRQNFIGSGVATSSVQVLHGVEFDVESYEDHAFEELFRYREDRNEVAYALAEAEKIYAHESLTFNYTIAYEVIYKWKVRLKEEMDDRSDVYVLINGYRKSSDNRNS